MSLVSVTMPLGLLEYLTVCWDPIAGTYLVARWVHTVSDGLSGPELITCHVCPPSDVSSQVASLTDASRRAS